MRITLRRAIAGSALVAAAAMPLQAGVAHATTPDEEFSTCITTIDAAYRDALFAGIDYDISFAVDQCARTFMDEIGAATAATADSVDSGTATVDDSVMNSVVTIDTAVS